MRYDSFLYTQGKILRKSIMGDVRDIQSDMKTIPRNDTYLMYQELE